MSDNIILDERWLGREARYARDPKHSNTIALV
jgi:hypothetical protein